VPASLPRVAYFTNALAPLIRDERVVLLGCFGVYQLSLKTTRRITSVCTNTSRNCSQRRVLRQGRRPTLPMIECEDVSTSKIRRPSHDTLMLSRCTRTDKS
jgi:hypothetical protein